MRNENVLLKLPSGMKVRDIKWLSIWCRRFTVNYGEVYISRDFDIPRPMQLHPFPGSRIGGRLNSGRITILDSESFFVPKLNLIVSEPGFHFWTGNSSYGNPGTRFTNF
jgi:hypothetical protein